MGKGLGEEEGFNKRLLIRLPSFRSLICNSCKHCLFPGIVFINPPPQNIPPPTPLLLVRSPLIYNPTWLIMHHFLSLPTRLPELNTADFIKKVLSVYSHSMNTFYLSLSAQIAKSTFLMKYPVCWLLFLHNLFIKKTLRKNV